jgi:hypothetical protein
VGETLASKVMDWPVSIVPRLASSLIINPITMDWPDVYCTHCTPTGWSDNNPIVHGLAGLVLYPSLTSWPAVVYNPVLGLCGADQGLG